MRYETFVCDICGAEHPRESSHESILLNHYQTAGQKECPLDICEDCSVAIHNLIKQRGYRNKP
jgi:hypothetical protein